MGKTVDKIAVLCPPTRRMAYQFFLQWFCDACKNEGLEIKKATWLPRLFLICVAKLQISFRLPSIFCSKTKLIVPGGGYPDSYAFPFGYCHEIIPVLWDTWPKYHERIIKSFVRHRVKLAFFTQRQVSLLISKRLPNVKCIWLPEGINPSGYKRGKLLQDRTIDLLELGRLMDKFHSAVSRGGYIHKYKNPSEGLLFNTFDELCNGLADAKITACFPRCDTHPNEAGGIETLTQRYWECMLSRTVIIGHCPKELLDLLGYNPVVEVNWENPCEQLHQMLADIEKFQPLVDRNYDAAVAHASWECRMPIVCAAIRSYIS